MLALTGYSNDLWHSLFRIQLRLTTWIHQKALAFLHLHPVAPRSVTVVAGGYVYPESVCSPTLSKLEHLPILDELPSFQPLLSLGMIAPRQGILHVIPVGDIPSLPCQSVN